MKHIMQKALALALLISVAGTAHGWASEDPQLMKIPDSVLKSQKTFEPSGAVYIREWDAHLLVVDDTDSKSHALLYAMNSNGEVADKAIEVKGLDKIEDMESVSRDSNGSIYILSSQGVTKKGKVKEARQLFVRAELSGNGLKAEDVIELRPILIDAIRNSHDPDLQAIASQLEGGLDVESHLVVNGNLFLGLKNPQPMSGVGLLLSVGSVDQLFASKKIKSEDLSVASIDFGSISNDADLISEILPVGDLLYITTSTERGSGRLWTVNPTTGELKILRAFSNLKPEGLSMKPGSGELMIVFDENNTKPYFMKHQL
jgi:hypothetical protein